MKEVDIISKVVGRGGADSVSGASLPSMAGYALKSEVMELQSQFNDFLEGEDTDVVINRWNELVSFLNGLSESDSLFALLGGKADKATTLAGYGITDAYTKSAVDNLLGNYVTLKTVQTITGEKNFTGGLKVNGSTIVYDATHKYWKLEGDLLVTGGVTMFASDSAFTPSTIMDAIATDGTNLKVVDGVLTFVGSIDGGEAGSVAWENVEGKPSWIGASKPSYAWSEITGKPSFASVATSGKYSDLSGSPTLLSSFTNDLEFVSKGTTLSHYGINDAIRHSSAIIADKADEYKIAGFGTTGGGFPINGGAIKVGQNNYQMILHGRHDVLRFNTVEAGTLQTWRKVWHDGNFTPSNYLLASSYSASDILAKLKTVDGEGSGLESEMTYLFKTVWAASSTTTIDLNEWTNGGLIWAYGNTGNVLNKPDGVTYCAAIEFGRKGYNSLIGQFLWNVNHNSETDTTKNLYFRASDTNGFLHSQWHTIAFTDSNVASATKLQTARTIWGQSFDGSGDVSGDLTLKSSTTSGSTPKIIFQRGTTSDSYYDSYIYNTGGSLAFGISTGGTNYDCIRIGLNDLRPITDNLYALGTTAYQYSNIYSVLGTFSSNVTIGGTLSVASDTTLATKLTLNGIPIYKSQDDVLYIDGNLAVRGGITMYATDAIDVPSIIDSLPTASTSAKGLASFDANFFSVDVNGNVSFIGSTGITEVNWTDVVGRPTLLSSFTNDQGFASSLGELANVGSWADSAPTQGRLLYQEAGSSGWSYKNISEFISETGAYLPLSGGTLSGLLRIDFLHSTDNISSAVGLHVLRSAAESDEWGAGIALTAYQGKGSVITSGGYGGTITYYNGYSYLGRASLRWDNKGNLFVPNVMFEKGGSVTEQYKCGMYMWDNILQITKRQLDLTYIKEMMTVDLPNERIKCHVITEFTDYIQTDGRYAYIASSSFNSVAASGGWAAGHILRKSDRSTIGFSCGGFGTGDNLSYYFYGGDYDAHAMRLIGNNMLVTGGITMYSDIRKKTKLADVELSLKQIANAPLIEHYYNSDSNKTTHVGSIAQYWAETIGNDWFCKKDSEGFYTMEIQNAALASAISIARELVKYESKTDRKIRLLKQRVKELEDKIEKLENN